MEGRMRFNTDASFVGIEGLKHTHQRQVADFQQWAVQGDWERFHSSHYDWWTFPIDAPSSYGLKWTVYEGDVGELKRDSSFLKGYCKGASLVAASWAWDLDNQSYLADPMPGQSWHRWPVRLYKAAQSVKLFGYQDLFESLRKYARELLEQGEPFSYAGYDLSEIFK
ncbi:MAG: hypothetical protein NTV14_08520 [Coprothermobacterota bacterium]|nr:hypothetical protein [Coprothermobacterota bacterium]